MLIPTRVSYQMISVILPLISIPKVEECTEYLSSRITHHTYICLHSSFLHLYCSEKGRCHENYSLSSFSFHTPHFFMDCIRQNMLQLTPVLHTLPYTQHTTAKGAYLESNLIHRLTISWLCLFVYWYAILFL